MDQLIIIMTNSINVTVTTTRTTTTRTNSKININCVTYYYCWLCKWLVLFQTYSFKTMNELNSKQQQTTINVLAQLTLTNKNNRKGITITITRKFFSFPNPNLHIYIFTLFQKSRRRLYNPSLLLSSIWFNHIWLWSYNTYLHTYIHKKIENALHCCLGFYFFVCLLVLANYFLLNVHYFFF